MLTKIVLIFLLLCSFSTQAKLITTSLSLDISRPFEGEPLSLKGYQKDFHKQIKRLESKQFNSCFSNKKIPRETPERLKVWWTYLVLKCANKVFKVKTELRPYIKRHIDEIQKYKGDLSYLGAHLGGLLVNLANSKGYRVSELEKNFLVSVEDHLSKVNQAKFYNFLAHRFEVDRQFDLAAQYYFKAYNKNELAVYSTRLKTVLNKNKDLISFYKDFYDNFTLKSKDSKVKGNFSSFHTKRGKLAKVREGIRLLNKYESAKYKVVSKIYRMVKGSMKPSLKSKWAKEINKCHLRCIVKFSERFFQAHDYKMSYAIAEMAIKKKEIARAKIVMGLSSLQMGQYEKSVKNYEEALKMSLFKSKDFFEASFRLGLVYFRLKKYDKAVKVLDNLEAHKEINHYNLQTTYWLWRSLQKLSSPKAKIVQNRLIKLYPLTYYGLKANYEKNNEKLILPSNIHIFQKDMKWTPKQVVSWENYKDFLHMQFFYLAKKELKILFNIQNDQEAVLYAHFSALAADHYTAIKTMNVIWNKNPYVNFTKNTTQLTLPREYNTIINTYADKYDVERNLVRSLIKQESSFRLKAVSSSNAMGLMQLVPITIKDSAKYLRIDRFKARREVFDPDVNVRMGTSYLYRMIKAFKGHVPLALAAYNAGIGNMRRWMKKRPDDLTVLYERGSHFDDEIWIDELPWAETSFYVKAILRNLILYRNYYEGVNKLPKPVWVLDPPITALNFHQINY